MSPHSNTANKPTNSLKTTNAAIEWSEQNLPRSTQYQDIYFSEAGAEEESKYVFLEANNVAQRWRTTNTCRSLFTIAELGFGSGLNFLQTIKAWQESSERPNKLHYIAFEKHPLKLEDMRKIHQNWPRLLPQSNEFLNHYVDHSKLCHRIQLYNNIQLDLYFDDALTQLEDIAKTGKALVDCWFLDGFSPNLNPSLWDNRLYPLIYQLSNEEATLSSYSAAGSFRKSLANVGFTVSREKGFGKKRHMTSAKRVDTVSEKTKIYSKEKLISATVIGAGLAGCSMAYSLAARGVRVTLLDKQSKVAMGASGIEQLALRPRLFKPGAQLAPFFLQSFLHTIKLIGALEQVEKPIFHPCGVLQDLNALNKRKRITSEELRENYNSDIVEAFSAQQASMAAGIHLDNDYLFMRQGGWVDGAALCERLIDSELISFENNFDVDSIKQVDGRWHANSRLSTREVSSDILVLCNSMAASELLDLDHLPLQGVRGQATFIPSSHNAQDLKAVLMGERTLFPANEGSHLIAATYKTENSLTPDPEDDELNIRGVRQWLGCESNANQKVNLRQPKNKVALRCNSSDFTPLVGLTPSKVEFEIANKALRRNAKAEINSEEGFHHGLYLNIGHGSNGLATCPLSSEYLSSLICGELGPLDSSAIDALDPARFLRRELKKQR